MKGLEALPFDPDTAFRHFSAAAKLASDPRNALAADICTQKRAIAATENNLGLFYHHVGQLRAAIAHLSHARDIEASLGRDAVNPATTLFNLAQVLGKAGQRTEALETLDAAAAAVGDAIGSDSLLPFERSKLYRVAARIHAARGELLLAVGARSTPSAVAAAFEEAARLYEEAGMPEDLVKQHELKRRARLARDPSGKPRLDEAGWRFNNVMRGEPRDQDSGRNAASSSGKHRRPLSAAPRRAPRPPSAVAASLSTLVKHDPVGLEADERAPRPSFERTYIEPATARVMNTINNANQPQQQQQQAGKASVPRPPRPNSAARRPLRADALTAHAADDAGVECHQTASARASRRSSFASNEITASVYSGLDPKHREAYDILAAKVAAAKPTWTVREAELAAMPDPRAIDADAEAGASQRRGVLRSRPPVPAPPSVKPPPAIAAADGSVTADRPKT